MSNCIIDGDRDRVMDIVNDGMCNGLTGPCIHHGAHWRGDGKNVRVMEWLAEHHIPPTHACTHPPLTAVFLRFTSSVFCNDLSSGSAFVAFAHAVCITTHMPYTVTPVHAKKRMSVNWDDCNM